MRFAEDQPKHGDAILHCGHLEQSSAARPAHWFKFEKAAWFERPDGSRGKTMWFAACEACFVNHGEKAVDFARGDASWIGDDPTIEIPEPS